VRVARRKRQFQDFEARWKLFKVAAPGWLRQLKGSESGVNRSWKCGQPAWKRGFSLTSEQLEASRAERLRQNGHGALTLEDARTWIEETGLCLFLPRRQFSSSTAPSFVEAVAGERSSTPDPRHVAIAEELLVRLEVDGIAVRLNLLGQPGESPDFVVAGWVLPYVYALRGDRDWRRSPQLTGSRQVSPLAVQAYKQLELGDATLADLKHALGREVTEGAVLRAITELWQQLRIIPVVSAPGQPAKWQLLRLRFQKAIAEGASTSQVTAISVLASIYLQAVIAASMEEVELFLAPLTARSKIREVLRGLVATRQVHTISLGHAPHFYVAGTLPEFAAPPTAYTSSSMPAFFLHSRDREEEIPEPEKPRAMPPPPAIPAISTIPAISAEARKAPVETHVPRTPAAPRAPVARSSGNGSKPSNGRTHFSRPATRTRDRKPAQSSSSSRPARRTSSGSRPAGAFASNGARPASGKRWSAPPTRNTNGNHKSAHGANGNGNGNGTRATNGSSAARNGKSAAPAWGKHNGHSNGTKAAGKSNTSARPGSLSRNGAAARPTTARKESRPIRGKNGKPALAAGAKAGNSKRYGFTARPGRDTKKRG
jgi:23S rRNA pseudouridine2605 synthase